MDKQPQSIEPSVDPDETVTYHMRQKDVPEPLWPKILGVVVAIIVIMMVFAPLGIEK